MTNCTSYDMRETLALGILSLARKNVYFFHRSLHSEPLQCVWKMDAQTGLNDKWDKKCLYVSEEYCICLVK